MRKLVVLLLFTLMAPGVFAQKKDEVFYVFKKDWSATKDINEAAYFMQIVKQDDTTFVCRYYQKFGPMVKQESFKDSDLNVPNGFFAWYNIKGNIDSSGDVENGKKAGAWRFYLDSTSPQVVIYFEGGKRTKTVNYQAKKEYYADGTVKDIDDNKDTTDEKHEYVQAKYPGGVNAWTKYLQKNMKVPDRFIDITRNGACSVMVAFIIDKEGQPGEIELLKSCEWSADTEAMRVIKDGGVWLPATIDGRKVIYRQKQSLAFSVSGG